MRLSIILGVLIAAVLALYQIRDRLTDIDQRLAFANCVTEARYGVTCPERKQ